jgi:hypothetical protein
VLVARGRLHDALRELDHIAVGDPLHDEAQRLRADVQQHLLSLATLTTTEQPRE